jgi:hypothetical protein
MHNRKTVLAASLAMALAVGVASGASALGDDEDPALAFCESAAALAQAEEALQSMDAGATTDEFQAAVDGVAEAASAMAEDARNLLESQVDAVSAAVGELQDYRDDVGGDQTLEAAVQGAVPYVAAIADARVAVGTVDCQAVMAGEAIGEAAEE